jgi:membrane protease YdiL (CAAX protease family)
VIALVLLGQPEHLLHPIIDRHLTDLIPSTVSQDPDALQGFFIGAATGVTMLVVVTILNIRRRAQQPVKALGDFQALIPRNGTERRYAALMAFTAGVTEELFYRAALTAVLFAVLNNAVLAIGLSIVVFALGHLYQGWKGVLGTLLAGWILTNAFLLTGTIVVAITLHVLIDLMSLVFLPWLTVRLAPKARR